MIKPELTKFEIPEEDRELFDALDTARKRIRDLNEILEEYGTTEKKLAAMIFSKFGIPPNQTISFQNWVVTSVGGNALPEPAQPKPKKGPGKKKAPKKKKRKSPGR